MAQEAIRGVTDVGRVIWGSVHERAKTDYDGKPYADGEGPIQFGLAVRKDAPGVNNFLGLAYQAAVGGYPTNQMIRQRIDQEWQSGFSFGQFRFKIKDGDKPEARSGNVNPNAAGCWVFTMSTTIPFKCANAQNQEIDPKLIKRGYFVDVAVSMKANEQTDHTAGIYINPNVVRLIAYGEEIVGGISIEDAFAGHAAPTQLPPGASLQPLSPSGGMPGYSGPQGGQPMMPQGGQPMMPQGGQPMMPQGGQPMMPQGGQPMMPQGGQPMMPQGGQPMMPQGGQPMMPQGGQPMMPQGGQQPGGPGQMPANFPMGGGQPMPSAPSPTGYPINPATGQPVQPNQGFLMPGQR